MLGAQRCFNQHAAEAMIKVPMPQMLEITVS